MIADCTGAILSGGRGTRLGGVRKALLDVGGEPLLSRTLRLFRSLFADVLIVANEPEPYARFQARLVPDVIPGKGAPGGLHAALSASGTGWVFVAACDMPALSANAIQALAAFRGDAPAAIVRWQGRLEPLHAFYSRRCLAPLDALLRAGDPSFFQLAQSIGARIVDEPEWRAIDPAGASFANINTPEDLARAT